MKVLRIKPLFTISALAAMVISSAFGQISGPTQKELADNKDAAANLLETRRKLDQLIWGPELLAQQYESRIVKLWDELLKSEEKLATLSAFPLNKITIAGLTKSEPLQLRIARYIFDKEGITRDTKQWQAFLKGAQKSGYRLEQSEWHHAKFQPPVGTKPAVSEVSFELHIAKDKPQSRTIIKGVLDIVWSPNVTPNANVQADAVHVKKMTILDREQPPAFEEVFSVVGTSDRPLIHPLVVYDLNQDGLSEILVGGQNIVLRNYGAGKLQAERLFDVARPIYDGAVLADFSGDGHLDFIGVDNRNYPLMYRGDADGTFSGEPQKIADVHLSLPKTFTAGDIDGDGDLDVHIANYKYAYRQGQMPSPYFDANDGYPAVMLRNDGDGKFTDVTEKSGLAAKRFRRSYSSSLVDLDDDADMDLIVVSDYAGFDIYLNDGKGKFSDVTEEFGTDRHFFGMGHTFDDFDGDGKLDFYVIGMSSTTARRLENLGLGRADLDKHTDMRRAMGYGNRIFLRRDNGFVKAPFNDQVARTGWSWGTSTFDFDNDGDNDIFVANGHYSGESTQDYCTTFWRHDIYEEGSEDVARDMVFQEESTALREAAISWNGYEHKVLFLKHQGEYVNIAYLMGVAFEYDARAVVSEDIDNDGRPDLLVVEHLAQGLESPIYKLHVYKNTLAEAGNWVGVQLLDSRKGSTIGAQITLTSDAGQQHRRLVTGDSFSSQHSAKVHFGLGQQDSVSHIEVTWANGKTSKLSTPKAGQYHVVSAGGD